MSGRERERERESVCEGARESPDHRSFTGHGSESFQPYSGRSKAPFKGGEGSSHFNPRNFSKDTTSFLFHNFPSNWEPIHLWKLFKRFGRVADVYIAKKYLRNGKKFGFVRFFGVRDIRSMEKSLNTIWIGYFKLRVYIAKSMYNINGSLGNKPVAGIHHNIPAMKHGDGPKVRVPVPGTCWGRKRLGNGGGTSRIPGTAAGRIWGRFRSQLSTSAALSIFRSLLDRCKHDVRC